MTLAELITDLKAAGANENTIKLALNCYELGKAEAQREHIQFPTMLRRMWSGGDVQDWLDTHVNGGQHEGR